MSIKLSGAEFKRFYSDRAIWGDEGSDTYVDDDAYIIDGLPRSAEDEDFNPEDIADAAVVEVTTGYLAHAPKGIPDDYVAAIRKWLRQQKARSILVEIDASKLDALKAAIKAAGGKVIA